MKLQESLDQVESHLKTIDEQQFDHLSFEWEDINFIVAAEQCRDGRAQIRLNANLGQLYYTIENSAHRTMAIEKLYSNNRSVDGAYSINERGDVLFQSLTTTNEKLTGTRLLEALTTILLQAEGHLRALKSHLKPQNLAA